MAKSVLELAVGTGQWDAGLRKAKSALDNFTQSQGGLQQALAKDSENIRKFVQMMGKTESTAKTAKGQMNDYKSTIEQLTMQYNRMTEAQKKVIGQDYLQAIEQMKQKYQSVNEEIQEMNRSLNNVKLPDMKDGGGLFSGLGDKMSGMMQVFGGNLLAEGVSKLTSELACSVQEGIELAKQGEGIRIAFERLNKPGLLDELKEATHGTVSEIELMQQAIKFENFKLPVEDLANYLAFAQQKAKDTGESIDYLVDSIVTGLGRQSKQILDNLGISAAELTSRMNEGATMTQAVSDIIREEMAKAGDYVETAADRAARAAADTKNKMEELGRSAMPVAEEFTTAWNEIKNGAMTIVLPVLRTLADSIRDIREILNGDWDMPTPKPGIPNLADGPISPWEGRKPGTDHTVQAPGGYVEVTDKSGNVLHGGHYDSDAQLQNMMKRWNTLTGATGRRGSRGGSRGGFDVSKIAFDPNKAALAAMKGVDAGPSEIWKAITEGAKESTSSVEDLAKAFEKLNGVQGVTAGEGVKDSSEMAKKWSAAGTAISAVGSAMSQIEDPAAKVMGTIAQAIATIALGYAQATTSAAKLGPWAWIAFAATGLATMISTISAIHSATGYANGGVIKGNSYSGDNIGGMVDGGAGGFVGLNAGEVVLNAAQQRGVASALNEGGNRRIEVFGRLAGETIYLSSDRYTRRTGRGTIMTWK